MISDVELAVQSGITAVFLQADVEEIELRRATQSDDGAGGRVASAPVTLPPQPFRLLPQEDGATARTTAEGETATPEYILLGLPDCDMARFDEFTLKGRRYQIVYIDNRQYEVKGEVIHLGN